MKRMLKIILPLLFLLVSGLAWAGPLERWAVVRDGKVETVIRWDGDEAKFKPPADATMVNVQNIYVNFGWLYNPTTKIFTSIPTAEERKKKALAALKKRLEGGTLTAEEVDLVVKEIAEALR